MSGHTILTCHFLRAMKDLSCEVSSLAMSQGELLRPRTSNILIQERLRAFVAQRRYLSKEEDRNRKRESGVSVRGQ